MIMRPRRQLPRMSACVPVEVRLAETSNLETEVCMSENISTGGILVITNLQPLVGAAIKLIFLMPEELTDRPANPFLYTGTVVRVGRFFGAKYSVAVRLCAFQDLKADELKRFYSYKNERQTVGRGDVGATVAVGASWPRR